MSENFRGQNSSAGLHVGFGLWLSTLSFVHSAGVPNRIASARHSAEASSLIHRFLARSFSFPGSIALTVGGKDYRLGPGSYFMLADHVPQSSHQFQNHEVVGFRFAVSSDLFDGGTQTPGG